MDHDHVSDPTWIKPEDFSMFDDDMSAVTTAGFPIYENDTFLVVAQQLLESGMAGDCMRILKCAIVDIVGADGRAVPYSAGKAIFKYAHTSV